MVGLLSLIAVGVASTCILKLCLGYDLQSTSAAERVYLTLSQISSLPSSNWNDMPSFLSHIARSANIADTGHQFVTYKDGNTLPKVVILISLSEF